MQMLANGGIHNGEHILGRKTIDLIRTNTLTPTMIKEDFSNDYLAGYGYGYGMRTLMNRYEGQHNGMLGQFGWTGGSGTWAECDPENESGDADPGSENTNRACGLSAQTRVIGDGGLPVPFRKFCSV